MSKNTTTEEAIAHNLKAVADEIGMKKSELHTGASRQEKVKAEKKAAAFGLSDGTVKDDRTDKAVRNDLRKQNAANVRRIAKHLNVRSSKLAGSATSTEMEEKKADILLGKEQKTSSDAEDLSASEQKKAVFGLGGDDA